MRSESIPTCKGGRGDRRGAHGFVRKDKIPSLCFNSPKVGAPWGQPTAAQGARASPSLGLLPAPAPRTCPMPSQPALCPYPCSFRSLYINPFAVCQCS